MPIQRDWWRREVVWYLSGYIPNAFLKHFRYVHEILPDVYLFTNQKTHAFSITRIA